MPEQALYLKWRPTLFDDFVGQEHITRTLRNSLKTGRIRHAYLFSGPRGTGKTTTARLLAKAVNCLNDDTDKRPCNTCTACIAVNEGRFLDLIEIDAATHTGVDDVRDLRDKIAFSPGEGKFKVYIIDEVHRFTGNAFDALLKTLEEPPDHAIFVLATTEIDKVPSTIKSRCLQFEFRRFSTREVADRLELIARREGLKIERGALELIARQGTGSMRDSISLLDQIVADPKEKITLKLAQQVLGTASLSSVRELVDSILAQDAAEGLRIINTAVDSGADPRQFGQQVVEHLRNVLLAQTSSAELIEASDEERALYHDQAARIQRGALLRAVRGFNEAINTYRGGWQPQLSLELALIESIRTPDEVYVEQPPAPRPQQSKPVEEEAEPTVEATPPGTPPLVPMSVIKDRWNDVLKVLFRYSSSAPAVMEYFNVTRVDGNVIILGTNMDLYYQRLQHPDKIKVIERALYDVHKQQLRIRLLLLSGDSNGDDSAREADVNVDDPLISTAKELGAKIHRRDNGK